MEFPCVMKPAIVAQIGELVQYSWCPTPQLHWLKMMLSAVLDRPLLFASCRRHGEVNLCYHVHVVTDHLTPRIDAHRTCFR